MKVSKSYKQMDRCLTVIKRLRETTGVSYATVENYLKRRDYYPIIIRSNYVRFVNDSFVINWLRRR